MKWDSGLKPLTDGTEKDCRLKEEPTETFYTISVLMQLALNFSIL